MRYLTRAFYVTSRVDFDWGRNNITDNTAASQGKYDTTSVATDTRLGKLFVLSGANRYQSSIKDSYRDSGAIVGLDLSAHLRYDHNLASGYTDSTGAIFGDETEKYWTVGGRARLVSMIQSGGVVWSPFVGVTLDRQFDYNHTIDDPANPLKLSQAGTFWGAEAGLNVRDRSGLRLGVTGSYSQSADQHGLGGSLTVAVPF